MQGALFKGAALHWEATAVAVGAKPHTTMWRKCAFDGRQAVKVLLLLSQKVTKGVTKFRRGAGCLFKGRPCWGRQPQLPGQSPTPPWGANALFDGRQAVKERGAGCFCVTFAESNKGSDKV